MVNTVTKHILPAAWTVRLYTEYPVMAVQKLSLTVIQIALTGKLDPPFHSFLSAKVR